MITFCHQIKQLPYGNTTNRHAHHIKWPIDPKLNVCGVLDARKIVVTYIQCVTIIIGCNIVWSTLC